MKATIDKKAQTNTDQWNGYKPLKAAFKELEKIPSGSKGCNFPEMYRVIINFKGWLRGMHHHVDDLQEYINESTPKSHIDLIEYWINMGFNLRLNKILSVY